jgi:two-component system sensor histidine kinase VicK
MQREFVANVSHELRTPLTNIRSYAETLSDSAGDIPPAMEKKFLGVILNESDRMTHIVQDLLTLSRFDSGRDDLKLTRFSFETAVQDLYNAVYMEAQRHSHTLTLNLEPDLPQIVADRERVVQVMMNIVSNSIKYTPDGGHIAISAGRQDDRVWMVVDDDGIGIPEEDRSRIFERFYRVDKARSRQSGGTGLGLSIAKEIVVRHQGKLALQDKDGPGLSVRLELKIEGPSHG